MAKSKKNKETFRTGNGIVCVQIPLSLLRSSSLSYEDKLVWVLAKAQEKLGREVTADEIAASYHLDPYSANRSIEILYQDGYLTRKNIKGEI